MNSYPHEFLAHPQPLMFVAGLTTTRDRSSSTASASAQGSSSRRPSTTQRDAPSRSGLLDPGQSSSLNALTTPLTSPSLGQRHPELPSSPPALASPPTTGSESVVVTAPTGGNSEQDERDRDFDKLVNDLRGALEAQSGKGKVWLPEQDRREFRILLVDKHVRLPARKQPLPAAPTSDHQPPPSHSPLSPLTPTSPAYPDGLIAPIWVRKHAELIPAVFVLFLRLWECRDPTQLSNEELERKEREEDDKLVKEIGERRRRLGERGIKLTVVLMASSAALDSPVLDPRLTYLRRTSSLSAKASLYVLTPVSADQLPDFMQSLQDAVYESAIEYYASHGKKIRRKRARLPSATGSGAPAGISGKTLGPQGWAVRYDFKAGWFAELRGEVVEARRHYEDCWNELAKMFSSTQTLPPRTKRWAEAKVLADCIAVRICRLLLYTGDAQKVLAPFHVHLKRFGDLSRGWGIGEETFEFWSWIARQYRVFAELLDMGQQESDLRIPALAPPVFPSTSTSASTPTPEYWATPTSGINPLQVLHQPAFYYYAAADCTLKRRQRFEEALAVEEDAKGSEAGGHVALAPGFANEKKVDHAALAVELFTKAYSLLKDQSEGQVRVALTVAFRIAETYCSSSQHELAMRFFDRISHTFHEDRWLPIVRQIRQLWYECAQITGSVETAARLLLEMMSPNSGIEGEERAALQDDFTSLLKTTQPASSEPIVIDMYDDTALLHTTVAFWEPKCDVGESMAFQVSLLCPNDVDLSQLTFSSIRLVFSDGRPDVLLSAAAETAGVDYVDLGVVNHQEKHINTGRLSWNPGRRLVINGRLHAELEGEVQVASVKLALAHDTWNFEWIIRTQEQSVWHTPKSDITPVRGLPSSVSFAHRPLSVSISPVGLPEGYVGERIPVAIKMSNEDDRRLYLRLSVFLQPGEEEDDTTVEHKDEVSHSLIQDIQLGGVDPSTSVETVIYLRSPIVSTRVLDFSLQASLTDGADELQRVEEVNQTVSVPIVDPLRASSAVTYRHGSRSTGEDSVEGWATVLSLLTIFGSRPLTITNIMVEANTEAVQFVNSSLGQAASEAFPQEWGPRTSFSIASRFALRPSRRSPAALGSANESPADIVVTWQSAASADPITTRLPLPAMALPPQDSFITAHLRTPLSISQSPGPAKLNLTITNSHPSATATTLFITVDPSDQFAWVGPRATHVAPLPPGQTVEVALDVVPLSARATGEMPRVRLWEGTDDDKEELDVVLLSEKGEFIQAGGPLVHMRP